MLFKEGVKWPDEGLRPKLIAQNTKVQVVDDRIVRKPLKISVREAGLCNGDWSAAASAQQRG